MFQQTVYPVTGLGVPGEKFDTGPFIVEPYTLDSALASYNVFGRGFSIVSEGVAAAGNAGGTKVLAGLLVDPKNYASRGTSGDPLAPTLTLPNGEVGQLATMGAFIVVLPDEAAIGDLVVYDNTTGILETIAPTDELPAGKSPLYAAVDRFTVEDAGLAVIRLNPTITYVPATP